MPRLSPLNRRDPKPTSRNTEEIASHHFVRPMKSMSVSPWYSRPSGPRFFGACRSASATIIGFSRPTRRSRFARSPATSDDHGHGPMFAVGQPGAHADPARFGQELAPAEQRHHGSLEEVGRDEVEEGREAEEECEAAHRADREVEEDRGADARSEV